MERIENIRDTRSFQFKKWALFTVCALSIVMLIIMASIGSKVKDTYIDNNYAHETAANRKAIKVFYSIIEFLISILIYF